MGCFSFMCKECGEAVLSSSFDGDPVELFLLEEGKVIEQMSGQYDSYGRVFDDNQDSIEWKLDWSAVCDLMHNNNEQSGISAVHTKCFKGKIPTEQSEDDPNQGWGTPEEEDTDWDMEEEYEGNEEDDEPRSEEEGYAEERDNPEMYERGN